MTYTRSSRAIVTAAMTAAVLCGVTTGAYGGAHHEQTRVARAAIAQTSGGPSHTGTVCASAVDRAVDGPPRGQSYIDWARARSAQRYVAPVDGPRRPSLGALLAATADDRR